MAVGLGRVGMGRSGFSDRSWLVWFVGCEFDWVGVKGWVGSGRWVELGRVGWGWVGADVGAFGRARSIL